MAVTPFLAGQEKLGKLDSRFVKVATLPWKPTKIDGIEMKILLEDPATGLMTALVRFAPGAKLPPHEHVEIEQSYVLEGSLADPEGTTTAGNYVWRPAGSRHTAWSPDGALVLAIYQRPNVFLEEHAGEELK
jgi:anti-sigma factor ChrR (cupin superfamily)